jgi:pyruvate dehydrogenase phosphatase
MFRRAWKPIAAVAVVGTPAYIYYTLRSERHQTFDLAIKVKGADGRSEMATRALRLLPMSIVEDRIRENATTHTQSRPGGPTWKYTTATLASNDPIEDANAQQVVQRDESDPSAPGDYLFFTVMDGHGGRETSNLLSKVLINAVALELNQLISSSNSTPSKGMLDNVKSWIWRPSSQPIQNILDSNPQRVSRAIEEAFVKLDTELLNAPIQILANNLDAEARKNKVIPDLSQHPLALPSMLPAISGG